MRPVASPELELLLLCARMQADDSHVQAISRLTDRTPDWDAFVSMAQRHGINPLVYRTLSGLDPGKVPPRILERLRRLYEANRVRNFIFVCELQKALGGLEAAGIGAAPHKGPALGAALYGDFAIRSSVDIDIRVKPCDAVKARRVMVGMGYVPYRRIPEHAQEMYVRAHCEFAFASGEERRLGVELHWRNSPVYFGLPEVPESSWGRLIRLPLAGASVPWLAPEDLLFDLCLHGGKHKWGSLKWIVDIAEFLRVHPDLDWREIMESARRIGAERMLALGVFLAHDLLDARVPADLWDRVQAKRAVRSLADEVCENLFATDAEPGSELYILPFIARLAEGHQARLYCRALLLPYFVLHRVLRPGMAAVRRAARR